MGTAIDRAVFAVLLALSAVAIAGWLWALDGMPGYAP